MVILHQCDLPTDGVRHKEIQTNAFVENRNLGVGTLYVAENVLMWISDNGQGFSLDYPAISLHAISKDVSSFPNECIYLMAETNFEGPSVQKFNGDFDKVADKLACCKLHSSEPSERDMSNGDGEISEETNGNDNGNDQKITEIRFVPVDKSSLEPIFQAMSDCQTLHPDENDSYSDDDCGDEAGSEFYPNPIVGSSEVEFDEHGQVVYRQPVGMRGVVPGNVEEVGNGNGHGEQDDDESMEVGQYDDVA